ITLPYLTQTSNFASLGSRIASFVSWHDLFYLVDVIILLLLFFTSKQVWTPERMPVRRRAIILTAVALVFTVNLALAELDRPQLLKRTFDRNYIVKYLGAYNFTMYDTLENLKPSAERVLADSDDITEV